ncbi:uncharacterized protein C6orf163 homolog [Symsagittifera roscoffensis]|uniref:uncharacterized protein C6orf163 homolog n=1 Tax=Symsagittifera roscoffensis TaxID=84072 RepID=UPI00307CB51C
MSVINPPPKDQLSPDDSFYDGEVPQGLVGTPRYNSVPKRYEETKPFFTQKLSHRNILDIGAKYHEELIMKLESERAEAVRGERERAEAEAEEKLRGEVERLHQYARQDRERALKQLQAMHDQQLTEEKMKIESQLNQMWQVKLEEVEEEKDAEMRKAVERTREACMAQLDQMVQKARVEERKKAKEEQEALKRKQDEAARKEREVMLRDKDSAMGRMKELLREEKDSAVAAAKIQEQNMAKSELATIISAQTQKLMEVEAEVEKREIEIKERDDVISRLEGERVELMGELNEQKLRLQYFVDSVSHFVPGENEHLVDKRGTRPYIPDVTPVIEGTDR